VAGPALGGIIAAWELGRQLGLPAVFTERDEGGTMILRRGFEEERGRRFLIAEDVITTGKSWGECAAALRASGASATAVACVVDRRSDRRPDRQSDPRSGGEIPEEPPLPLYAACRVEAQTWEAASCELCGQGSSPVKPGSRFK
jgi:orotate phosphoribosyltransferase